MEKSNNLQKIKKDLIDELKSRVDNKIIEESNYLILKKLIDKNGTIHIFEIKSVNRTKNSSINEDDYNRKVNQLKKCYKFASKKTEQVFYLPILDEEKWTIFQYKNGEEKPLTKEMFKEIFK